MKTQEEILAEIEDMENSPVDYSDIPPMTEQEQKSIRPYYKEFLDMLPEDIVKELARRRLSEIEAAIPGQTPKVNT